MARRRRTRRGPNPKYWWVWAIGIVLLILLAQNTVGKEAYKNALEREKAKEAQTQTEQIAEVDSEESPVELPND